MGYQNERRRRADKTLAVGALSKRARANRNEHRRHADKALAVGALSKRARANRNERSSVSRNANDKG